MDILRLKKIVCRFFFPRFGGEWGMCYIIWNATDFKYRMRVDEDLDPWRWSWGGKGALSSLSYQWLSVGYLGIGFLAQRVRVFNPWPTLWDGGCLTTGTSSTNMSWGKGGDEPVLLSLYPLQFCVCILNIYHLSIIRLLSIRGWERVNPFFGIRRGRAKIWTHDGDEPLPLGYPILSLFLLNSR